MRTIKSSFKFSNGTSEDNTPFGAKFPEDLPIVSVFEGIRFGLSPIIKEHNLSGVIEMNITADDTNTPTSIEVITDVKPSGFDDKVREVLDGIYNVVYKN